MALLSSTDLEAKLGRNLTADELTAFTLLNAALQSQVERLIGSSIESVSASTRYYDGGVQHLKIDPCTAITAVKYVDDETAVEFTFLDSDITKEPVNKTLKTMLRNRDGRFNLGMNNVSVTAKFSIYDDTATLNIVKNAMLDALSAEIDSSDNIKSESIEGYSVTFETTQSKNALDQISYLFPEV
jgi:hypothetical protein